MTLSSFPTGTLIYRFYIVSIKTGCLTFSGHTAFFLPFVPFPSLQMDGIRKNDQRDFEEQLIFGITLLLLNITVWSFSYNQFTVFYLFSPWLNVYFSWRGIWDCLLSKQFDWAPQRHKHTNIESPYKAFEVNIFPRILKFAQTWLFARLFANLSSFISLILDHVLKSLAMRCCGRRFGSGAFSIKSIFPFSTI